MSEQILDPDDVRSAVRQRYGEAARLAIDRSSDGCCGPSGCGDGGGFGAALYSPADLGEVPAAAALASLGCGNPTALAELRPGEVVLDLGSGGGLDVLLSARRVGPTGFAYGLDMTDEMLVLAEANRRTAGVENARFLKGTIEAVPLPDASVDVIISNCVVNLSPDKDAVLREAFRVLKPGGRLAISDIVLRRRLPEPVSAALDAWSACIGGALTEDEYREKLLAAGFADATLETVRVYRLDDLCQPTPAWLLALAPDEVRALDGAVTSAFIRATRPPA